MIARLAADVRALLRGEPVLAAAVALIAADLLVQVQGDGLSWGEVGRIVAVGLLSAVVRAATTPAAAPVALTLRTDPPVPAQRRPVITLTGRR